VQDPLELFLVANKIGGRNGVGRVDIVENRFIGLKSRGCYESPGMELLRSAHLDLEGLVLDREVRSLRDQFVTTNFSKLLYNGLWFSAERELYVIHPPQSPPLHQSPHSTSGITNSKTASQRVLQQAKRTSMGLCDAEPTRGRCQSWDAARVRQRYMMRVKVAWMR